ncbi:hypothetical protein HYFRA_00001936 [Hymenoscyphus fraxineus]|uniref:Calcineurin-like phosphoesterase domain-containing protein n=1 Tax=Hymenoscyphus fraxineus TaxID=746836 RepID=A0A9N9KKU3_9HELO|nr:hypothetical protein HYFRA_00001936 [Hymenoscyphus fraxineus]
MNSQKASRMPLLPDNEAGMSPSKPSTTWTMRQMLSYLAVLLGLSWGAFYLWTPQTFSQEKWASEATNPPEEELNVYGSNAHPTFKGMVKLMDLPEEYVPQTGKHRKSGRLVVVGDVHGMKDSLVELLEKMDFNEKHDHLILAGDMISKGPDSPGVVDLAMKLGATCVRGNHEDRILLAYADMEAEHLRVGTPGPRESLDEQEDLLEEESFSHGNYKDRKLVKQLGKKRIKWLQQCPVILRVGKLGDMGEVVVVHAGLTPGVKLERQDPVVVMNVRTVKNGVPSDRRNGTPWAKLWNKHQKALPKKDRSTVIYGHDAKRGLRVKKYSMGIDTGCLKGGKLTAVVIEGGQSDHKHKLYHVGCKDGRQT